MRLLKLLGLLLGLVLLAASSFFLTLKWLEGPAQRTSPRLAQGMPAKPAAVVAVVTAAKTPPAAQGTYCEVSFPVDDCSAHPGMFAIGPSRQLRDTWEGADKSQERCMRRAQEYHAFCKIQGTVTARFYSDGRVVGSKSVP